MRKFLGLILTLALAGCGGSNDFEQQVNNPSVAPSSLSGQVLAEDGSTLAGVRIVAQERTTNQEFTLISGADGSFQINLPAGVYDVAFDKEGDQTTASSIYGPVTVQSTVQRSFTLHGAGGRSAATVFGKIFSQPGVPAPGRTIQLRPGFILADVTADAFDPSVGVTDAQGNFTIELSTSDEMAFDLELQDAGGAIEEFVDLSKSDKPCYAELSFDGSAPQNVFRSNQGPPPTETLTGQVVRAQSSPFFLLPFDVAFNPDNTGTAVLSNGGIAGTGQTTLANAVKGVPDDSNYDKLIGLIERTSVAVDDTGTKSWGYKVYVNPDTDTLWKFTDAANDTYSLYIFNTNNSDDPNFRNWHYVAYNSLQPGIIRITFHGIL